MTVILHNALLESPDLDRPAYRAAERWRPIRERLLKAADKLPDDAGDRLEALCFVIDEVLADQSLTEYVTALEEVTGTLLEGSSDTTLQLLVVGEVQRLALPS